MNISKSTPNLLSNYDLINTKQRHNSCDSYFLKKDNDYNQRAQPPEKHLRSRSISINTACSSNLYPTWISSDENSISSSDYGHGEISLFRYQRVKHLNNLLLAELKSIKNDLFSAGKYSNFRTMKASELRNLILAKSNPARNNSISEQLPEARMPLSHMLDYKANFVQKGETCKIAALGYVLGYYDHHGFNDLIPVYKKQQTIGWDTNYFWQENINTSLRKISKQYGSVQGEIAYPRMIKDISTHMGFTADRLTASNLDDYINYLVSNIDKGYPVIVFMQVNENIEADAEIKQQWAEHSVVAVGYDLYYDSVVIVDHGKYKKVDICQLWEAAKSVNKTRKKEIYARESEDKRITFINKVDNDNMIHSWKWIDLQRLYDTTNFKLSISGTTYEDIEDVEQIPESDYLRKSKESETAEDHFRCTLMVIKPSQLR